MLYSPYPILVISAISLGVFYGGPESQNTTTFQKTRHFGKHNEFQTFQKTQQHYIQNIKGRALKVKRERENTKGNL